MSKTTKSKLRLRLFKLLSTSSLDSRLCQAWSIYLSNRLPAKWLADLEQRDAITWAVKRQLLAKSNSYSYTHGFGRHPHKRGFAGYEDITRGRELYEVLALEASVYMELVE